LETEDVQRGPLAKMETTDAKAGAKWMLAARRPPCLSAERQITTTGRLRGSAGVKRKPKIDPHETNFSALSADFFMV
jgi:hypothetical protein